ncbi:MAG: SDR family oxidoreductase [Erythrobacter sp.]
MKVLVTGAAGLLGGAVVDALVQRGVGVIAMVHREPIIRANSGRVLSVSEFDGSVPERGEIRTLEGDVTQPNLGLRHPVLKRLQEAVTCVIHCAALVRFEADFRELKAVNVDGTCQVAQCFPKARIVHVSTAYACGLQDGAITETVHSSDGPFSNGYERSKAVAEIALRDRRPDAIIARPSIIVGEQSTGQIRSFDAIYQAFKMIAEGRIAALPVASSATLNFVPIDHVVEGVIALATRPDQATTIVHLTAREAIGAVQFLNLIGKIQGLHRPKTASVQAHDPSKRRLEAILQPYFSYFTRSPQFRTEALELATDLSSPVMDETALLQQIQYCVDMGFIRTSAAAE